MARKKKKQEQDKEQPEEEVFAIGPPPGIDEDVLTKERFERLLTLASQPLPESEPDQEVDGT